MVSVLTMHHFALQVVETPKDLEQPKNKLTIFFFGTNEM